MNGYKYSNTNQTVASWDPYMAPKLNFEECYYDVLEAQPSYDGKQLKKAYYKVVFKYHPDGKETIEEKELSNKQMMVIHTVVKESSKCLHRYIIITVLMIITGGR